MKKGTAVKFSRKNENIKPFESGGETSLEFFSQKTDCSIFVVSFYSYYYHLFCHFVSLEAFQANKWVI